MNRLAALLALTLLGGAPAGVEIRGLRHPALSPDGRRIAFDWHGDLWICPADGGAAERVTDDAADDQKPCWSPDGRKLAYSSDRKGNRDIFVLDLATRKSRQLTVNSADDDAPAWSPDGEWIAFQSNRDSNLDLALNNLVWDLWKVPADGGTATRITRFRGENPAWSPDGKWIAYDRYSSGYADGEHNLFVVAPDGSGVPREIASGTEDSRRPVFRGNQIFFSHEANGIKQSSSHRNVWRTVLSGGPLLQVTGHLDNEVRWPTTTSPATALIYERDFALYSIDPRVQQPKPLKLTITADVRYEDTEAPRTFTAGFRAPAWSPSGARIAFVCRGQVWTAAADGSDVRVLTSGLEDHRDPSWTPDGKQVVYIQAPAGSPGHLWIAEAAGERRRMVTHEAREIRKPRVSPDGTSVLLIADAGGTSQARKVDLDTGDDRAVMDAESAAWSPDGKQLACVTRSQGVSVAILASLDGKVLREVKSGRSGKADIVWSPDGSRLAWADVSNEGRGIRVYDLESSTEKLIVKEGRAPSWSPDSSMLLTEVDRGQPDSQTLAIVDAKGGGKLAVDLKATRPVTRREDMTGVFMQVWSAYQANYYDPFFHGVDWTAAREKYRPLAEECQTPAELYDLINDMIRELRSSHVHLTPAPLKNTLVTGSLAADLLRHDDGTLKLIRIEPNGPAAKAGLKEGELLIAAGGEELGPRTDLDVLLSGEPNAPPPEVRFLVRNSEGETREVAVRGIDRNALRELKYENRIAARKKLVKERSGGRLGYHHIKMMVAPEVSRLKTALENEWADAEGLVLDERDGVGGLAHKPVCMLLDSTAPERLNAVPACHTRNRNGTTAPDIYGNGNQGGRISGKSWDKPVIMVQNEISRSDKEILPFTFRYLGIGYLVGMPTAGGVIGGSDWIMRDGSKITVSTQGWFSSDGRNLEGYGVPPDFRAMETHEDLLAGRDAALEKAVEVLLAQMDGKIAPPKKPGPDRKLEGQK